MIKNKEKQITSTGHIKGNLSNDIEIFYVYFNDFFEIIPKNLTLYSCMNISSYQCTTIFVSCYYKRTSSRTFPAHLIFCLSFFPIAY